jgi:hypothetical protein
MGGKMGGTSRNQLADTFCTMGFETILKCVTRFQRRESAVESGNDFVKISPNPATSGCGFLSR